MFLVSASKSERVLPKEKSIPDVIAVCKQPISVRKRKR